MLRVRRTRRRSGAARPWAAVLTLTIVLAVACLAADVLVWPTALALSAALLVAGCLGFNVFVARVPVTAPSTIYTAALAAFHLGLVVPWTLGWAAGPRWLDSLPDVLLVRALLCVVTAFAALEVGLLAGWRYLGGRELPLEPRLLVRRVASPFYSGGRLIAGIAALAAFVNLCAIGLDRFVGTSYGYEFYALSDSRLVQTGLYWLLPVGLLISLAGARPGHETRLALGFSAAATLTLLWLGDRGGAVSFVAGGLVVWTYTRGAFALRTVAVGALVLLFVLPAVFALRQLPRNAITIGDVAGALGEASPVAACAEMGATLRPLAETLRLVPAQVPYRHGRSYLGAALRVIPNAGLTRQEVEWTDPADLPPNHWITFEVEPWTWAAFGGLGYSGIAEPYLNFGVAGVVAFFVLLGFLLGRTDAILAAGAPRRTLALAAVVFMSLLLTVRNDFFNFVRPAAWDVCLVVGVARVLGVRRIPRRALAAAQAAAPAGPPRPAVPVTG